MIVPQSQIARSLTFLPAAVCFASVLVGESQFATAQSECTRVLEASRTNITWERHATEIKQFASDMCSAGGFGASYEGFAVEQRQELCEAHRRNELRQEHVRLVQSFVAASAFPSYIACLNAYTQGRGGAGVHAWVDRSGGAILVRIRATPPFNCELAPDGHYSCNNTYRLNISVPGSPAYSRSACNFDYHNQYNPVRRVPHGRAEPDEFVMQCSGTASGAPNGPFTIVFNGEPDMIAPQPRVLLVPWFPPGSN